MTSLQKMLHEYLSVRRALGYKLEREGLWLPEFVSFLKRNGSASITTDLALQWATQSARASVKSWAKRLGMVRGFAYYVRATDPKTEVPSTDLLPFKEHRFIPYIYSAADIEALLRACDRLPGVLMPLTYRTLLGLLAVSGMRVGEAIHLDRSDVNEREHFVTIRFGKFGKSREVPLHATTIKALKIYAEKRDLLLPCAVSKSFFVSQTGQRLWYQNVWSTFSRLRKEARIGKPNHPPPRIHDLRHTFAVTTLLRWYGAGVEVEPRLASLSTYLGHVSPSSTYWYLSGTPELLAFAAHRLETNLGELS